MLELFEQFVVFKVVKNLTSKPGTAEVGAACFAQNTNTTELTLLLKKTRSVLKCKKT